jgi:hypothetical protein
MSAQNERMSPNKNQGNQFIDLRLLTKKKENHAFSFFFINLNPPDGGFRLIYRARYHATLA